MSNKTEQDVKKMIYLAHILMEQGDLKESESILSQALDLVRNNSLNRLEAIIYNNLGLCYDNQQIYDKAMELYLKAASIFEENELLDDLPACLNNIAAIYNTKKEYQLAINTLNKSLNLYLKKSEYTKAIDILENLSIIYDTMGDITNQIDTLNQMRIYLEAIHDNLELMEISIKLSDLYEKLDLKEKLVEILNKIIELADLNKDTETYMIYCSKLGNLYQKNKDYQKALFHHQKSLIPVQKIGQIDEIISVLINIGINLSKLGDNLEKNEICKKIEVLLPQCEDIQQQESFLKILEQLKKL